MMNDEVPNLDQFSAQLEAEVRQAAAGLGSPEAVENFRLEWLGRKQGRLKLLSEQWLKAAPAEAKREIGQRFNALKALIDSLLEEAAGSGPSDAALAAEALDVTLPGTRRLLGVEHPITRTTNELIAIFAGLGYSVGVGPQVETDYY